MKKLSEHLGEVIVAIACIALFISSVALYRAPIGDFFAGIADKVGSVGTTVLVAFENDPDGGADDGIGEEVGGTGGEVGGGSGSASGGESDGDTDVYGWIVPDGCTYYVGVTSSQLELGSYTGATATYTEGQTVTRAATKGDVFVTEDYEYRYSTNILYSDRGWNVLARDVTKSSYGEICDNINGVSLTDMARTFQGCSSLTTAPVIPSSVIDMGYAFRGCTALTKAPLIPSSVTHMQGTFLDCSSLTTAPVIPSGVTNMSYTFAYCEELKTYAGSTDANGDFSNYVIPSSVIDMGHTFQGCSSLTTAPAIPSGVTIMTWTFYNCASLTTAPVIPSSVTNMNGTFLSCKELKTYVGSTDADGDFSNYVIPSSVTNMIETFSLCKKLTGDVTINANPTLYSGCFSYTVKPINLTGSSTMLSELAATATNGNVTVK